MTGRYHRPNSPSQSDGDRRLPQGYDSRQSNQYSNNHTSVRQGSDHWGHSRGHIFGYPHQQAPSLYSGTSARPSTTNVGPPPRSGPHNSAPYSQVPHSQGQPAPLLSYPPGTTPHRQTPNPSFQATPDTANSGYGGYYGGVTYSSSLPGMAPASHPGYHQYAPSPATGGHRGDSPPIPFRLPVLPYNDPNAFSPIGISSLTESLAPPRAPGDPCVENETYNDNLTGSHPDGVENRDRYYICPTCGQFTGAWGCRSCGAEQFMSWAPR